MTSAHYETVEGFTLGTITLDGTAEFQGSTYRIEVKNENMAAWLDETIVATVPDLITLIDTTTGEPVTNPHACSAQKIAVILLPAPVEFTTDKALNVFGPAYAGIN